MSIALAPSRPISSPYGKYKLDPAMCGAAFPQGFRQLQQDCDARLIVGCQYSISGGPDDTVGRHRFDSDPGFTVSLWQQNISGCISAVASSAQIRFPALRPVFLPVWSS